MDIKKVNNAATDVEESLLFLTVRYGLLVYQSCTRVSILSAITIQFLPSLPNIIEIHLYLAEISFQSLRPFLTRRKRVYSNQVVSI